ncbi:MAG: cell division topological specificity factor MinE [Myxococcales bacterium]|nr:cell division topological specificity factor MinE [Myxococcales bacterium]
MGLFAKLQGALGGGQQQTPSKDEAKQRLKLLLIHDQVDLSAAQLDRMKEEIIGVIAKYCEIDNVDDVEFKLNRLRASVVLHSTIPVRRVTARA